MCFGERCCDHEHRELRPRLLVHGLTHPLIRIIDLSFVSKDADGAVAAFELSDLNEEVRRGFLGEDDLMDAAA